MPRALKSAPGESCNQCRFWFVWVWLSDSPSWCTLDQQTRHHLILYACKAAASTCESVIHLCVCHMCVCVIYIDIHIHVRGYSQGDRLSSLAACCVQVPHLPFHDCSLLPLFLSGKCCQPFCIPPICTIVMDCNSFGREPPIGTFVMDCNNLGRACMNLSCLTWETNNQEITANRHTLAATTQRERCCSCSGHQRRTLA